MNTFGFLKVAVASPNVIVGDVQANVQSIAQVLEQLRKEQVQIAVFPELCLTGYTCGDLFQQQVLLEEARKALDTLAGQTKGMMVYVGLPMRGANGALYNCAALLNGDKNNIRIDAKTFLPNYSEFYEARWFTPYHGEPGLFPRYREGGLVQTDILPEAVVGCELCEDLWVPASPSLRQTLQGATVVVNLSAGNEVIGKADYRRELVRMTSAKQVCCYLYASAGMGESTQDAVYSGHSLIAENGIILAEKKPFDPTRTYITTEIDLQRIQHERMRMVTFTQGDTPLPFHFETAEVEKIKNNTLTRAVAGHPFVPTDQQERSRRAKEITEMQAWGLARRIAHTQVPQVVVGISGGLDSTLALLVSCQAFDLLGKDRKDIIGITMPGFGTTGRTYENAKALVKECGATLVEIPIRDAATQHLNDLNHALDVYDITYENAQARERTQVLFDYANMHQAIVVGTGDLSELALGWCTYNGDHMSNYGVNASIPKTLVRYLVRYFAEEAFAGNPTLVNVLHDIIETPVSPELLPPDKNGQIAQKTENSIGSYLLHDFILYYVLRYGFRPSKIYFLAKTAMAQGTLEVFNDQVLKETMRTFYRRFFGQQFKRSCMPDGVKVGTVCLSPRGDWRMPSDASAALWLREVDQC